MKFFWLLGMFCFLWRLILCSASSEENKLSRSHINFRSPSETFRVNYFEVFWWFFFSFSFFFFAQINWLFLCTLVRRLACVLSRDKTKSRDQIWLAAMFVVKGFSRLRRGSWMLIIKLTKTKFTERLLKSQDR